MKRFKTVWILALAAILIFSLAACDEKKEEGPAKEDKAEKKEIEAKEYVLMDKVVIKYPASFEVDKLATGDSHVTFLKEGEKWEVNVSLLEYGGFYEDWASVEADTKSMYGDKVARGTMLGKDAIVYDDGEGMNVIGQLDDENALSLSCKNHIEEKTDYKAAFETEEVQFILENLAAK